MQLFLGLGRAITVPWRVVSGTKHKNCYVTLLSTFQNMEVLGETFPGSNSGNEIRSEINSFLFQ